MEKKISKSMKGKNTGKLSENHKKNIGKSLKGRALTDEHKNNIKLGMIGVNRISFDKLGYHGIHGYIHEMYDSEITRCEICGIELEDYKELGRRKVFDGHCVDKNYRNIKRSNWIFCCSHSQGNKCHGLLDYGPGKGRNSDQISQS